MDHLVVDSKHGKRALLEVAPMFPTIQQDSLADMPIQGQYSQQGLSYYPTPSNNIPVQESMGVSGHYMIPRVAYGRNVYPGQFQPEMYPSMVPDYGYPGPHYNEIPTNQSFVYPNRPNIMQQETQPASLHYHFPGNSPQRPATNPVVPSPAQPLAEPPKPKSAHYFYGPDGGLLSGPDDFYRNLDPQQHRDVQSEPAMYRRFSDERRPSGQTRSSGEDFLVEGLLRYGKLRSITVKNASPSFKTLPEFLVDELESKYRWIPETHVVLVAVNGSYSIYASPSLDLQSQTPEPRAHRNDSTRKYPRHNSAY